MHGAHRLHGSTHDQAVISASPPAATEGEAGFSKKKTEGEATALGRRRRGDAQRGFRTDA
jgi:hypothetical protein